MPTAHAGEIELELDSAGVRISGERAGEGVPVLLLHGLTATRQYVVMGSRALERSGHLVIGYDARGHGSSTPAHERRYGYEHLSGDLAAVLNGAGVSRALIAGASMGAHTAVRFALEQPDRVAALALITPAFDPEEPRDADELERWDRLAAGLREGGIEGFLGAYELDRVPPDWRARMETVIRQRLAAHHHPEAVATALEVVPRSRPFEALSQLAAIAVPTLVIASRDELDPGHPLALGERYAQAIRSARLVVEPAGAPPSSPIAWQGGQLSRLLGELAASATW